MRKLYILMVLALAPLAVVLAQPTILVGNGSACTGETFCVPVTSQDFTNINSLDFDFGYDPAVLSFTNAQNFSPAMQAPFGNLSGLLFDNSTPGIISFGTWETGDCSDAGNIGVTLDDDVDVLFELCFEAVGAYGEQSTVGINASPTPVSTRNATLCNNIGVLRSDGEVTLCVRELNITAADVTGNEGDQVCVDFTVEGFDQLNGIQFTVNYDPAFLDFANLFPNTEIPNNTLGAYGLPNDIDVGPGNITVVWSYTQTNPASISVVDGTTMFTVCFDIIGACENSSPITFSDTPTPIEANNADPDNPNESSVVPVSLNTGTVQVNDCNPEGIEIKIDCGDPVNIGDVVCVEFQAGSNFDAVRRLEYLMTWNPNILEFQSVDDPNNLSGLGPEDFDTTNTGNGVLGLEWEFTAGPPQNMTNMELIYRVCFTVVGVGGDSPVQIVTPGIGVSNGVNIGINPTNCVVQVNQPASPVIDFGNMAVPLGGTDCVPVTVSNFNDVLSMQFTMAWDEMIWLNTSTQNINPAIAGANPTFTPIGTSSLGFSIDNGATPITLADNSVLFEVCFTTAPTANPGDSDQLISIGLPFPESAITSTSNGENIGLIVDPGTLDVLFPEGFGLTAVDTSGGWLDTICMDFTVESFDNITAADFNINWDPTVLQFVSSSTLSWADLTLTSQPVGTLNGTFNSPVPVAIPDGDVAFQVCFQLIGDPNECYPVSIQDNPAPTVETTNGAGSIVITNGEICVEEQIVITDITVVPPSCPGECDGEIIITVAEWDGQGFIGTTWTTENPAFMQFDPLALDDVCEGMTIFTVFDNDSGVSLTDTIFIVSDGEVPTAVIEGDDPRELDCNSGLALLTAEDQGPGFNYTWYQNAVGAVPDGDGINYFASTGDVILCVINEVSGCVAYDTVTVTAPTLPEAIIDEVTEGFTCITESITLNGGNSVGQNLIYTWYQGGNGEPEVEIASGPSSTIDITEPDRYRLKVTNSVTGCMNSIDDVSDIVFVMDDGLRPSACIVAADGENVNQEQNCDGTPNVFDASCSNSEGFIVDYAWFVVSTGQDLGNGIMSNGYAELDSIGLIVTEVTTGCSDTTYAQIIPNANAPEVTVDEPAPIDCNNETVILNATLTPNDPTFTFVWNLTDGATLEPGTEDSLSPTVTSPGTAQIVVTNPANGCEAEATVVIADSTQTPIAQIANDPTMLELSCIIPVITLDGTPSDDNMTYQWYLNTLDMAGEIEGATADTLDVSIDGVYILQVINVASGCSATDTVTVTGQFETPMVTLDQLEPTLDCDNPTITVTATISNSTNFTVASWTSDPVDAVNSAVVSPDGLSITIDAPAVYTLVVTSDASGCTGEGDFVATTNFAEPTIDVPTDSLTINCAAGTVQLSGAGSATGQDFTYLWENQTGDGPDGDPTMLQTTTTIPGTYLFTVTNNDNGCTSDTLVMVGIDTLAPTVTIMDVEPISCADPSRELTAVVTDADNFTISWDGPSTPMPDDALTTTITAPGTYTATVVNTDNGCSGSGEVTVDGDLTEPTVIIAEPAEFDCPDTFITLDGGATGDEDDFDLIQWSLFDVQIPGANSLTYDATELGEYTLSVVSAANGCTGSAMVTLVAAQELTLPELPVLNLDLLGCTGDPVVVDASAADVLDFSSVNWVATNGAFVQVSPFVINATEAGTYTLMVVQNSPVPGCEATMDYEVMADPNTPVADAGPDMVAGCGEPAILDASGSTPPSATFVYDWMLIDGAALTAGTDGQTPTAPEAGMHQLIVTNVENGCTDTSDIVTVTFAFPDDAFAGDDTAACDDMADLSGNLPAGLNVSGVWTTAGGAVIDMPANAVTMVSMLQEGSNVFTWTLSAEGCPDFSSDDVAISRASTPIANPDFLEIDAEMNSGSVSLIANDVLGGSTDFTLTILSGPGFGTYDTAALDLGNFVLNLQPTNFGTTEVTYQICSTDCPDLCDSTTLLINVEQGEDTFVPNTVTPNNDGANDELIFDVLLFNDPELFPDNELIIFNRWGDIIYEAKPYNNDWTGLNKEGQPVPEATYYYILRLNISQGEIIRGDITVIR